MWVIRGRVRLFNRTFPITNAARVQLKQEKKIDNLETLSLTQAKQNDDISENSDAQQCVICLENYTNEDTLIKLKCAHLFHKVLCVLLRKKRYF